MDITVDGSEIRRSPDEVGSLIPLFSTGFQHHQRGGFLARFLPSTVFCIFSHICPKKSSRRIPPEVFRVFGCFRYVFEVQSHTSSVPVFGRLGLQIHLD